MLFPCVCRSTFSVNKYEGKGVEGQKRIHFICFSSNYLVPFFAVRLWNSKRIKVIITQRQQYNAKKL